MKIAILVPTKDGIPPESFAALAGQEGGHDVSMLASVLKPAPLHREPGKNKSLNILRNRIHLRKMALASDAEWFFLVDTDVVVPKNAVAEFLKEGKDLMAGWYKKIIGPDWVAGNWKGDIFEHYEEPQKEAVTAGMAGLGCMMMRRSVLERIPFRAATEEYCKDENGMTYYKGQCMAFCEDALKLGIPTNMIPTVVCKHLIIAPSR